MNKSMGKIERERAFMRSNDWVTNRSIQVFQVVSSDITFCCFWTKDKKQITTSADIDADLDSRLRSELRSFDMVQRIFVHTHDHTFGDFDELKLDKWRARERVAWNSKYLQNYSIPIAYFTCDKSGSSLILSSSGDPAAANEIMVPMKMNKMPAPNDFMVNDRTTVSWTEEYTEIYTMKYTIFNSKRRNEK